MSINIDEYQIALSDIAVPGESEVRRWLEAVAQQCESLANTSSLSIRVVDNAESQQLNRQFRGKDQPTNVLAFPSDAEGWPPDIPRPLGEIVVCAPVVVQEAAEQRKAPQAHWCHMLVHGALHLLGYDHNKADQATEMERLESVILSGLGFSDPYRPQAA